MSSSVASPELDLTIDQLAARTGMTVRNVRAYSARGLLPPPRLVGRTGHYNGAHVARLTLVREMLDRGYTLTAAERLLAAARQPDLGARRTRGHRPRNPAGPGHGALAGSACPCARRRRAVHRALSRIRVVRFRSCRPACRAVAAHAVARRADRAACWSGHDVDL